MVFVSASSFEAINSGELRRLKVPYPEQPKRRKIAEILSTCDDVIEKTEELIKKYETMKEGLMHDLFTRGIDPKTNSLRPKPEDAPNLYKPSTLGPIPKAWEVKQLGDLCSAIIDCPHSTPGYGDYGILVARTMHIRNGLYDEERSSRISEQEYVGRISRLKPLPGDIVFTREAPVGEAFTIPEGMKICLGQRVMLLRPYPLDLINKYLVYQIYSKAVKSRITQLTGGTTNPHLNVAEVRGFSINAPSIVEQELLVSSLEFLDNNINTESLCLEKQKSVKEGLLKDLLSGNVEENV